MHTSIFNSITTPPLHFHPPSISKDPDECADSTLNDCDQNAICKNEKLSFVCVCKEGFKDAEGTPLPGRVCVRDTLKDRVSRVEKEKVLNAEYEKDLVANRKDIQTRFSQRQDVIEDLTAVSVAAVVCAGLLVFIVLAVFLWHRKKFGGVKSVDKSGFA